MTNDLRNANTIRSVNTVIMAESSAKDEKDRHLYFFA